jgi:hypothetical protein
MLFSTPTQFAVLALLLVAGWLFGLASHPGGRKWRQRYSDERDAHAVTRKEQDARTAEANARIRDLEAENTRLARATPVTAATIGSHDRVAVIDDRRNDPVVERRVVPATAARPYTATGDRRGWFDWGNRTPTNG